MVTTSKREGVRAILTVWPVLEGDLFGMGRLCLAMAGMHIGAIGMTVYRATRHGLTTKRMTRRGQSCDRCDHNH